MEERPHKVSAEEGQSIAKKILVDKESNPSASSSSESKRSSQSKDTPASPEKDEAPDDKNKPGPSSRSSSPEPNCAICLEPLQNKSFTDSCFHTFCFTCLVEWSKVKPECPLCKQQFKSIVHNVQKDLTFDEYHISSRTSNNLWTTYINSSSDQRFRYATTQTHGRLLERSLASYQESYQNQIASHRMRYAPHSVRLYSSSQIISRMPCNFRRRIYDQNLWVKPVNGRTRIVNPDFYRRNPACTHRLLPWLNRELVALLQNNETQVTFVMELIMALVARYEMNSQEFLVHIEPYMGTRTRHFIHELYNFAISPYDMENYDRHAEYGMRANIDRTLVISSSPDSDIIPIYPSNSEEPSTTSGALDMSTRESRAQENQRLKKLVLKKKGENTWESIITPGPLVNYTTMHCYFSNPGPSTSSNSYLITEPISSASPSPQPVAFSDDDECQVVNVVKPRGERTPEIVDLSSDDENMETIIDISSDNDTSAVPVENADNNYYVFSSPHPAEDDSDVECVYEAEQTASTSRSTGTHQTKAQEVTDEQRESSSKASTSRNEASSSNLERMRRVVLASAIVRPWDIGSFRPVGKSRRHAFRSPENEAASSDTATASESSPSSKKLKLTSVVAHFSINRSESKKESGHRSSHKKHKEKKKKKKKKHLHKHRRRVSSETESG